MVEQGDFLRDAQAKAEVRAALAGRVGAVEALEDGLLLLVGDAGAVVGDRDAESGCGA